MKQQYSPLVMAVQDQFNQVERGLVEDFGEAHEVRGPIVSARFGELLLVDVTSGPCVIYLPQIGKGSIGQKVMVKNDTDLAVEISVKAIPSDTIDGLSSFSFAYARGRAMFLVTRPNRWAVVAASWKAG